MTDEDVRLAHYATEARARQALLRAPSPQGRPESHAEALMAAHEGRPTVAEQRKRECYP